MKRKITIVAILAVLFCISRSYAYWIWTPKSGKWVNPKTAVKNSPEEQLEFAVTLFESDSYDDARREFNKVLKHYPKSFEASESQYYLGRVNEAEGKLYEAFLEYQKVIEKYPFSERIQEIIERQYNIGEAFMAGEKRKALGITIPVENPAIEIFAKVIENSTFGPLASKAQYKLGLVLKGLGRYYEAEEAFQKVISNYPQSEWVAPSQYQIASCRAALSRGPDYDQGTTKEAKQKYEEFIEQYPQAVLSVEAQKNIESLNEREAQHHYETGRFYEKQREYKAAQIYYSDIIDRFPQSEWAVKALERLQVIKEKE